MVKKIEIADRLGLHVATVSRILNEVPDYRASKETIKKVFDTAREMGYDFERQKRFYKRKYHRIKIEANVRLHARMQDGNVISHEAKMINIGKGTSSSFRSTTKGIITRIIKRDAVNLKPNKTTGSTQASIPKVSVYKSGR